MSPVSLSVGRSIVIGSVELTGTYKHFVARSLTESRQKSKNTYTCFGHNWLVVSSKYQHPLLVHSRQIVLSRFCLSKCLKTLGMSIFTSNGDVSSKNVVLRRFRLIGSGRRHSRHSTDFVESFYTRTVHLDHRETKSETGTDQVGSLSRLNRKVHKR